MVLPGCPTGWEEMWMGYSFLMASTFYKSRIFGFDFYEHLFWFLASSWIKCKFYLFCDFSTPTLVRKAAVSR
jgi:C-terminal tandem repeated domain in type 4 procollagen